MSGTAEVAAFATLQTATDLDPADMGLYVGEASIRGVAAVAAVLLLSLLWLVIAPAVGAGRCRGDGTRGEPVAVAVRVERHLAAIRPGSGTSARTWSGGYQGSTHNFVASA
jgi:hypothetical protein